MSDLLEPKLKQRGRASIGFLAALFHGSKTIRDEAKTDIKAAAGQIEDLPDDLDMRSKHMKARLQNSRANRLRALVGEWHATHSGPIATEAFEEIFEDEKPVLERLTHGPAKLFLDPKLKAPTYWDGVEYHRTTGGWDGHDYSGYIHGEIIHRKMVDAVFPGGIFKQRLNVAARAPKAHYGKILDMGCSTGHFTQALAQTYPKAKIYGVDLSPKTLEHAQRVANAHNWDWQLYQKSAEATGFEDSTFDLVGSYILLHEMPDRVIRNVFKEAFRVLKSGGDILMSDVTRYADMDKLGVWKADEGARYGGEPHWRNSASLDMKQIAEDAGFVDVAAGGIYPYVVQGRKP